jgi:ribonuclease P protein component
MVRTSSRGSVVVRIAKKILAKSVDRNRVKRKIRSQLNVRAEGWDIIIYPQADILGMSAGEVRKEIEKVRDEINRKAPLSKP